MAGPSILCKTLLRRARILERDTSGSGETYLQSVLTTLASYAASGGKSLMSVATASKNYTFAQGYSVYQLQEALDEALILWDSMTTDELANLLDSRPIRTAILNFKST